jgi:hypothetical protein
VQEEKKYFRSDFVFFCFFFQKIDVLLGPQNQPSGTVGNLLLLTVEPTREGNLVSMHTKLAREELLRQFQQQR